MVSWLLKWGPKGGKKVSETITKIAPTISKNLSDTTRAKKIQGFLSNLRKKELKDFEKTKKVSEIKKKKKKKKD